MCHELCSPAFHVQAAAPNIVQALMASGAHDINAQPVHVEPDVEAREEPDRKVLKQNAPHSNLPEWYSGWTNITLSRMR